MLFKRGSTISAAEGGCQAEVGGASCIELLIERATISTVACSMAAAGFAACMGGISLF
jgi:L-serine deaminase